jgi:hypothetical protein
MTAVDKRALKALLSTYWSPAGWRPEAERATDPAEFEHARSAGLMFEAPLVMDHDHLVRSLRAAILSTTMRAVSDAFIASLSTRRLDLRSVLGSYAVFQHMPVHGADIQELRCATCGSYIQDNRHDANVLSFERWKWGGVRHEHPIYAFFDLSAFVASEPPNPSKEDVTILRDLLAVIRSADSSVTSSSLETRLAKVLKSNKAERDILIGILGFCGVLNTPGHPPYTRGFVPVGERRLPDRRFVDMAYPACWWTGRHGVDENAVMRYFGHAL